MLRALAGQEGWTVAILRGSTTHTLIHRVLSSGISDDVIHTHAEAIRRAVRRWLAGGLWRDAEETLRKTEPLATREHICGWARVNGVWTCIGDHYAVGIRAQEETACGATLPEYP